jgi:hypothetical protein
MSQTPMDDQTTHGDTDASHRCTVCGRRKELVDVFHHGQEGTAETRYESVCPRTWAHGSADS